MRTSDFDYELPPAAIAQRPLDDRAAARLLIAGDGVSPPRHARVRDLPAQLRSGDLVVVNRTRVLPARLALHKATGGAAEVLLLERAADGSWEALVRPGRRLPPGTVLHSAGDEPLCVEVGEVLDGGRRRVRLAGAAQVIGEDAALERHGAVPLPPYITESLDDPERYQTVFASVPGSVAAPTAGLHLTTDLLEACRGAGAAVAEVELVVGLDTFRPIIGDDLDDHVMHSERYVVPGEVLDAARAADRVVAIGTTVVRALESAARTGDVEGRTDLFIRPGFSFEIVDVLLTNFHLPRSSLLVLVEAFAGPRWRDLYALALAEGYRFLSFGDAMVLERS